MKNIKKIVERQLKTKKKLCEFPFPSVMIKKFSSPKIKIWFEPIFLSDSLAVFKIAAKPLANSLLVRLFDEIRTFFERN